MRKKTYLEQLQDRINGSADTSIYTDKPNSNISNSSIKSQVDNLYNRNKSNIQQDNIWERVKARANNILNDNKNIIKNLELGISSSAKSALYYIENSSENIFSNYKKQNQFNARLKKDRAEKEKIINGNYSNNSKIVSNIENLRKENKTANFENLILQRAKENSQLKSPILEGLENSISNDEEKIQKNIESSKTKIGKKVSELMPSIGQSASGMALGIVNPVLGLSYFQTSAGGNYTREAKERGLDEKQAMRYGTIMGAMESITESVGAKLTTGVGKAVFKDGAKEGLKAFGLDVAENFFEEAIMEPIQEIAMKTTGGQADFSNMTQRMWNSGIDGALTSVIMGGASAGIGKATKLVTKIEQGQQVKQEDIVDTLKAINESEEVDIEKLLVNSFQFTAEDLFRNTDVQKNTNAKLENIAGEISTQEAQNIIQKSNLDKNVKEKLGAIAQKYNLKEADVQKLIDNTKNGKYEQNQSMTINSNEVLNNNQQVTQKQGKNAQNQNSEQINNTNQNLLSQEENGKIISEKIESKTYKNSENAKTFLESAVNNNFDIKSKEIETISKILDNRNLKGSFNNDVFNGDTNKSALYVNGEVILNPKADSKKGLYDLVIHETAHSMLDNNTELKNTILETLKTDSRYEQMYNDIASHYSEEYKNSDNFQKDVEEEMIADYLGENLSTEEFITKLSEAQKTKNQSKVKHVIDNFIQKIKDFFTSRFGIGIKETDAEKYYWNKVENLFYDSYLNSENASNENSKYSFAGVNSKSANYNTLAVAETLERSGKSQQEIYEKTGWYRGSENKWRYEIHDSNFQIKTNIEANKGYNLNSILLNADELYKAYPQLEEAEINFVDLPNNIAGGYDETHDSYIINNNLINNNIELKKTLLHEIQHNIQAIEDFSRGNSDNWQKTKIKLENKLIDIDKQIDNINNKIGFEDYKNNLLNEYFSNNNFNPDEYFSKLDEFQNNSKYAEQIQRLKAQKKSLEEIYSNIKNRNSDDLYQNTAGEQESFDVEKRLDMSLEERKAQLPFVKNKKTVYNIDNKMPYEFNGDKYELFLKEDIKNGKNGYDINVRNKESRITRDNKHISSSSRAEQDRYFYRQTMESQATNKGEDISNFKRNTSKNKGLENKSSSFYLPKNPDILTNTKGRQIDISNLKETSQMKLNNYNRKYNKENIVAYRGISDSTGNNSAMYGLGLYTTVDKKYASKYGEVEIVDSNLLPDNPLKFKTQNDFKMWEQDLASQLGIRYSELLGSDYGIEKYVKKLGYDGLMIGTGKDTDLISFKENKTNTSDVKYSQNTEGEWNTYLKETSKNNETRKTLGEVKLPQRKEVKLPPKQNESTVFNINDSKVTRHDVIQENRKVAKENIKNIATWKDKKSGLKYQLETMERNMYDIIPDKKEAQKIIDTYFEPVHTKEAEKQKFINKYNSKIQDLKLNKYEAEATQFLGELKYNPSFKMTPELKDILDRVNNNIQSGKINKKKIDTAIETFRKTYDELFDLENNELRRNGYQEKPYRKGYFPHFIDYIPETKTEKLLNKLGLKIDRRALPTDISGITEQFVPGKTWNQSSLERKTNKTDFNALKGFDTYIAQAADNIFHTENIQRLRGLENEIRYQYSEKGIQQEIDSILSNETLNQEEKQALIEQKFEQIANPIPNLVVELRRYTNALANKKSEADRSTEQTSGRQFYSIVNAIENRFAGNAVGLNIGSALTNFIPITQAYSQVNSVNMGRAMLDTMKSYIKDDGFIDKSTFLTNRLNKSEKLYKTALEKISEKANIPFDAVDSITSNIIVRGKYLENIKNGMSEKEAIKNADSFAASLMADRSKGALPTKFEEKNPLTKAFTQFQLEVNNQYRYMLKDIPRDLKEKGLGNLALAYFKMFISAWLYNKISEEITGRDQAFSPIDLLKSSYDTIMNDDLNTYNKITNIVTEFGEQAPFIGGLLGGGRIPVNGALPNIANMTKAGIGLATGEMDTKKALNTLGKEVAKPVYYLLPPFGGGQLKKTVEGIKTVKEGGSYGIDNKGQKILQFPVENKSSGDYIKAGIFGKYSLPKAKDYVDNEFKSFNAKQTQLYDNSNIEYDKLKEYFNYSSQKGIKQTNKIECINKMNLSTEDKWNLYKYNIISDSKRKDGTSQLTDAEYVIKNKLATKNSYMKLYEDATKSNIDFPDMDRLRELKKNGLSLNTYIDYKIKYKEASEEKKKQYKNKLPVSEETKSLKLNEKIELIKNYSLQEKRIVYSNYINKDDEIYNIISKLEDSETNIDEYLDYKIQKFESDENTKSNIVGKKVSKGEGTSKNKTLNYINNSKMTDLEKAYIVETKYSGVLDSKQLEQLVNIVTMKITDKKELEEVLKKFKDLEKHKDNGNYYGK